MTPRTFTLTLLFAISFDVAFTSFVYFGLLPNTRALSTGITLVRKTSDGKSFNFVAGPKNKKYIRLRQLPDFFADAVLALEDARFYQHRGFDLVEIQNVVEDLDERDRPRGASTITQQLAKTLYLSSERSIKRKLIEALIAIKLELTLSKAQILELYLNSIDWGRGLFGIYDAAIYYFKKDAEQLNLKESVFLAAIIPNPKRFGKMTEDQMPRKRIRRQMMNALKELYRSGTINFIEFEAVMENPYEFSGDDF